MSENTRQNTGSRSSTGETGTTPEIKKMAPNMQDNKHNTNRSAHSGRGRKKSDIELEKNNYASGTDSGPIHAPLFSGVIQHVVQTVTPRRSVNGNLVSFY